MQAHNGMVDDFFNGIKNKRFKLIDNAYVNPEMKSKGTYAEKGEVAIPLFVHHKIMGDAKSGREIYVEIGDLGFIKSYNIDMFSQSFVEDVSS